MLTKSEREWLEDRKRMAYCRYCNVSKLCANPFASGYSCPLTGNMKDAAEFSERVAALISKLYADKFADVVLKHARLAVEEEMDG